MPLAFESKSHGSVAFGFFNIETDLLLLDQTFFFAEDFCALAVRLALARPDAQVLDVLSGWIIENPAGIGNLHAAIAGVAYQGLIGAVYRLFPFPRDPRAFKQNPDGHLTRDLVLPLLKHWAVPKRLKIRREQTVGVKIGDVAFDLEEFGRLVEYVHAGGYPRWKGGLRPAYVQVLGDHYAFLDQTQT